MLYIVNKETGELKVIESSTFQELNIWERKDLEKWIENYPEMLGEELFVITTEYDKFDKSNDRLDVLAIDKNGKLVVIELKRDVAPTETELQALKYAAFCSNFTLNDLVEIYAESRASKGNNLSSDEARDEIYDFIQEDTFEELDNKPRIILAAREFKQETTSSIMWLRSFGVDITCVKLELHGLKSETGKDTVAINSSIIIPLPDAKEYLVDRERKETEITEMTKNQRFYKDFYGRLIEKFKQECPGITERTGYKDSWLGLPVGYSGIHFEWWFKKRPKKAFEVGLHLEKNDKGQNQKILKEMEKIKSDLEQKIAETLHFDYDWGDKWAKMYVEQDKVDNIDELGEWILETTKKFYKYIKPELDRIMSR